MNRSGQSERKENDESVSDKTFNSHSDSGPNKFERILMEMEQEGSDTYDFSGIGRASDNLRFERRKC